MLGEPLPICREPILSCERRDLGSNWDMNSILSISCEQDSLHTQAAYPFIWKYTMPKEDRRRISTHFRIDVERKRFGYVELVLDCKPATTLEVRYCL